MSGLRAFTDFHPNSSDSMASCPMSKGTQPPELFPYVLSSIGGKCLIMTEWSSTGRNYARIKTELRGSGKTWHGRNWWDNMVILLLPLPSGGHNYTHWSYTQSAVPVWCWTSGPGLPCHPKVLLIQGAVQAGDTWKASAPA